MGDREELEDDTETEHDKRKRKVGTKFLCSILVLTVLLQIISDALCKGLLLQG